MPNDAAHDHRTLLELYDHPGHLLRRAQQISVSIFHDELGGELTPVQYAILNRLASHPGIDRVSLAGLAAIDTSTGATVCARLEEKGLLGRKVIPSNRRQFMELLAKLVRENNGQSRAPLALPQGDD